MRKCEKHNNGRPSKKKLICVKWRYVSILVDCLVVYVIGEVSVKAKVVDRRYWDELWAALGAILFFFGNANSNWWQIRGFCAATKGNWDQIQLIVTMWYILSDILVQWSLKMSDKVSQTEKTPPEKKSTQNTQLAPRASNVDFVAIVVFCCFCSDRFKVLLHFII